ncbi:MAG: hypothetical protein ACK5JR_17485 [Tropicimonas sp.]|uniref:hypothetical protein n=1 Tax=Tropicimonas sp. TaxID=2067044 RepID=UPI003A856FFB
MQTDATRMDEKLARIRSGAYTPDDFIIADAKDADMGSGITGLGPRPDGNGYWTREEFLDRIISIIEQDEVDIMLVSASLLDRLHKRGAFDGSAIKPAIRANDTTDCWGGVRHGRYAHLPSVPFRTADLGMVMYGSRAVAEGRKVTGTDLGLYSMTFVNDLDRDLHALNEYARFRAEAGALGFRHFLEIFNPNVATGMTPAETAEFVNDCILRCLAGVTTADRPEFLKMPFNGPRAMEELASFDSELVVGVLGGGAGTTRDAFELISQAEKYGARLALFGRKINLAESQEQMVSFLRRVVKREVTPQEAVRAYHSEIAKLGLEPQRPLEDDLLITEATLRDG